LIIRKLVQERKERDDEGKTPKRRTKAEKDNVQQEGPYIACAQTLQLSLVIQKTLVKLKKAQDRKNQLFKR
jgi:hypothetical protein